MTILQEIVAHKQQEVASRKELVPIKRLEQSIYFDTQVVSMSEYLRRPDKVGVIAEIKRRSPSEGLMNGHIDIEQLSIGYMQAGASALSVLSDEKYFGGSNDDVTVARKFNFCPILRKDFIVDEYQLVEAKSIGADCVLLIAAALEPGQCHSLARSARTLGLEVILEVHALDEIHSHLCPDVNIVGVNNRDLHTFTTSIDTSLGLVEDIPDEFVKISESGISDAESLMKLVEVGFDGFLIGGWFMKHAQPEKACAKLIKHLELLQLC